MTPRAQLSRPPLERMLRIHDELRRGSLVNCTKLVKTLEVCRKSLRSKKPHVKRYAEWALPPEHVHNAP